MFRIATPHPVEPLTMAEARRIVRDTDFAMQFDPMTRQMAWRMCTAARKGRSCPVLILVAGIPAPQPEPPKDAA